MYEDRDRIARDLHDLVIQRLFATGMMLESAQRQSAAAPEAGGASGARRTSWTPRSRRYGPRSSRCSRARGGAGGLRARVLREVGTAAVPLGFQPSVVFTGPVDARVSELTGRNLIAALREALSNVIRHARASRVEIVVDATVRIAGAKGDPVAGRTVTRWTETRRRAARRRGLAEGGWWTAYGCESPTTGSAYRRATGGAAACATWPGARRHWAAPVRTGRGSATRASTARGRGTTVVWEAPL
ncbi:histidine kinase [Streptomyces sp. M19]